MTALMLNVETVEFEFVTPNGRDLTPQESELVTEAVNEAADLIRAKLKQQTAVHLRTDF